MKIHFFHHSFHNQTSSSQFMIEILLDLGHDVLVFSREDLEKSKLVGLPDIYILWQSDRLLPQLRKSKVPILCIPMLDDALALSVSHYRSALNVKYIAFSKTLHRFLKLSGCDSSYIQFWPSIENPIKSKSKSLFFWERNPSHLNLDDVLLSVKNHDIQILVRQKPDPHDQAVINFKVESDRVNFLSNNWWSRDDYLKIVAQSQVFVSPRPWEGIGLSFLEAMALGCCVVAFNNPTMNEYIENGKTGILINARTSEIDLAEAQEIGNKAREVALEGSTHFQKTSHDFFTLAIEAAINGVSLSKAVVLPKKLTLRKYIFLTRLR